MERKDLIALIDAKIAGQGNQIDLGGALASVLVELAGAAAPIEVADITKLTPEQLDALNVGDKVVKVTGVQKHLYLVTYKGSGVGEGLVLTYNACGYGEAVSYNFTAEGWAYGETEVKTYGA